MREIVGIEPKICAAPPLSGFATDGVFDEVHESEGLTAIWQSDAVAVVPTFKEAAATAIPVITIVWRLG